MSGRKTAIIALLALGVSGAVVGAALAAPWDKDDRGPGDRDAKQLQARPFVFVGTAAQCAPLPPGANVVTSAWLGGMGLPDDGMTPNAPAPGAARDPHLGLLLNKNGPTLTTCAAAGATIKGFRPGTLITELGFDYRDGGHCGAGAPRFNITTTAGQTFFVGCAAGAHTPAPQDPQWIRVRFSSADVFPAGFVFSMTPVRSIDIIFDEGTDQSSTSDPNGVGLAVIDNIDINGTLITQGRGIAPKPDGKVRNGREDADED